MSPEWPMSGVETLFVPVHRSGPTFLIWRGVRRSPPVQSHSSTLYLKSLPWMCIGVYDFWYLCHLIVAVADPARRIVDVPVRV
jgi:hypothetical protein